MEFILHNEEGIIFPPIRPAYTEGRQYFGRFMTLIPRGETDSIIGKGGAGMIHIARDQIVDRLVALKLLHDDIQRDPAARQDVIRETRQAMELTHPNIVRINDFHESDEGWGISMQYVNGKNLDEWRYEHSTGITQSITPYPVERIEGWIAQLCDALSYTHDDARMVHRDVKPKNLMLEKRAGSIEKLYLTDFGITQKLSLHTLLVSRVQPTQDDKAAAGTLPYMPWQQLEDSPASIYDDIYAIGATIYELITGRPPFYEGGYDQMRHQIEKVVPPSMSDRLQSFDLPNPGIPKAWEEVVAACLAKKTEDRPTSVREISEKLGLTEPSPPPPPATDNIDQKVLNALQFEFDSYKQEKESETSLLLSRIEELKAGSSDSHGAVEALEETISQQTSDIENLTLETQKWHTAYQALQDSQGLSQDEALQSLQVQIRAHEETIAKLAEEKSSSLDQLNTEKSRFQASNSEIESLQSQIATIEKNHSESLHDTQQETIKWEQAYLKAQAESSENEKLVVDKFQAEIKKRENLIAQLKSQQEKTGKELTKSNESLRTTKLSAKKSQESKNASLKPLLIAVLGSIVLGLGVGMIIPMFSQKEATEEVADLSSFKEIPPEIETTGSLVTNRLFIEFLKDSRIQESDFDSMVTGITSSELDEPVAGVSYYLAESFCAWLNTRQKIVGGYFHLPSKANTLKSGDFDKNVPEWLSDDYLSSVDNKASIGKYLLTGNTDNSTNWQIPSARESFDQKPIGFRVHLSSLPLQP